MIPFPADPIFWAFLTILADLQVADFVTTRIILDRGGYEQNPVAKFFMELLTVNGFLVIKGFFVVAAGYYIGLHSLWVMVVVVAFYVWVIRHNMKSIK